MLYKIGIILAILLSIIAIILVLTKCTCPSEKGGGISPAKGGGISPENVTFLNTLANLLTIEENSDNSSTITFHSNINGEKDVTIDGALDVNGKYKLTGDITATGTITGGSITANGDPVKGMGDITATGGITAATGNITAADGSLFAGDGINFETSTPGEEWTLEGRENEILFTRGNQKKFGIDCKKGTGTLSCS
jgi:hypothetical protein